MASEAPTLDWLNQSITIQIDNKPLHEILNKIGQQTGIAIVYDQSLANERVMGKYQDIPVSEALNRLFRGKNTIFQINDIQKVVVIKTFGAKHYIWTDNASDLIGRYGVENSEMTLEEIADFITQQYLEFENELLIEVINVKIKKYTNNFCGLFLLFWELIKLVI